MKLDPRKPIPPKIEVAVANVINMKMKNSSLPNNSIQLNTGGSQRLTLTPISVARKDSDVIAKRTLRARTKQSKDVPYRLKKNRLKVWSAEILVG